MPFGDKGGTEKPKMSLAAIQAGKGVCCPDCGCGHLVFRQGGREGYSIKKLGANIRVKYCRNCGKRVMTKETQL